MGQAAELYFSAFEGKIGGILGHDGRGARFIERAIDPDHSVAALTENENRLLGVAGFKTQHGALIGGELSDLAAIYGWFGGTWRGLLLSLLERDLEEDVLLMDGIAVAKDQRGRGIGTKLLTAIVQEARNRQKSRIRLDVIDINPRAKSLYKRMGFCETGREDIGLLRHLFGFSSSTTMEYSLAD